MQEQFVIQTQAREQFPKSLSSHTAYPDIVRVAVENADIVLSFCAFAHEWRLRGICSGHAGQGSHRQAGGSKLHLFYRFFFWPERAEWDSIVSETRFFVSLTPGTAQWTIVPQTGLSQTQACLQQEWPLNKTIVVSIYLNVFLSAI